MKNIYLIALSLIPRVGRKTLQKIYLENHKIKEDEFLLKDILVEYVNKFDKESNVDYYIEEAIKIKENSNKLDINIITVLDQEYPNAFKTIKDFPIFLNIKGNQECLTSEKNICIIGTREISNHGYKIGYRVAQIAIEKGYNVVSGLALGSDTSGHLGAVDSGGKTIAVMPTGLDEVYPKSNTDLANKIIKTGGCLVSEYFINSKTNKGSFVERDRLQAALSKGIFVIETDVLGGTMHAVNEGINTNKVIACYLHPKKYLHEKQTQGNQKLINENKAMALNNPESMNLFFKKMDESQKFVDGIYLENQTQLDFLKSKKK